MKIIEFKIRFKIEWIQIIRKPAHAMLNIIIPIYLLAVMSCCSFLMPFAGGERFGFVMTIQLGLVFSMTLVESELPPSGDQPTPMIYVFIYFVNGLCLLSFLTAVLSDGSALCFKSFYSKSAKKVAPSNKMENDPDEPSIVRSEVDSSKVCFNSKVGWLTITVQNNQTAKDKSNNGTRNIDVVLFILSIMITSIYIIYLQLKMEGQYPERPEPNLKSAKS